MSVAETETERLGLLSQLRDPLSLAAWLWPDVTFYKEQRQIIYAVEDTPEVFIPAGNVLGKDFAAGFIVLSFFLRNYPCKILTTSATERHLNVLWGEMDRFIRTSQVPLIMEKGGPLCYNQTDIKRVVNGNIERDCYIQRAVVSSESKGEGLSGHHSRYTLFVSDEASGVGDVAYRMAQGWAKRMLIFGNPNPTRNFFYRGVKRGSMYVEGRLVSKVIKIKAEQSPNVRLGLAEKRAGREPSEKVLVPGVLTYSQYLVRRATWDKVRQCVGLDAEFPEGAETLMFPPEWLNRAEEIGAGLPRNRRAEAIGIDTAAGGDNTAMAAVDRLGLIELASRKTPDTSVIASEAKAFIRKHRCPPEKVYFDAGGGGQQHADYLRRDGYAVQMVAFGGAATPDKRRGMAPFDDRVAADAVRYAYRDKRAELYHTLRIVLDPGEPGQGFGLPAEIGDRLRSDGGPSLRGQLAPIPLEYDENGRIVLRPKNKRPGPKEDTRETLIDLIGCSPDEAEAVILGVYGMRRRPARTKLRMG